MTYPPILHRTWPCPTEPNLTVLSVRKVLSGSDLGGRLRLMGKYIVHRRVARPEPDNIFWTDSTWPTQEMKSCHKYFQELWSNWAVEVKNSYPIHLHSSDIGAGDFRFRLSIELCWDCNGNVSVQKEFWDSDRATRRWLMYFPIRRSIRTQQEPDNIFWTDSTRGPIP